MPKKGTKHERTDVSSETLRDFEVRLRTASQAFGLAAQTLEDSDLTIAKIRNVPQMNGVITKVENSAIKATLDVNRSISEAAIAARAVNAAKEAMDSIKEANLKAKRKGDK